MLHAAPACCKLKHPDCIIKRLMKGDYVTRSFGGDRFYTFSVDTGKKGRNKSICGMSSKSVILYIYIILILFYFSRMYCFYRSSFRWVPFIFLDFLCTHLSHNSFLLGFPLFFFFFSFRGEICHVTIGCPLYLGCTEGGCIVNISLYHQTSL